MSECDGMTGKRDVRDMSKCCGSYVQGMTKPAANWGVQCCNVDSNEMCIAVFSLLCKQYVLRHHILLPLQQQNKAAIRDTATSWQRAVMTHL